MCPVVAESRAAIRIIEAGTRQPCVVCEQLITYKARVKACWVICNVYEDGKWVRVDHMHERCYDGRYGEPSESPTLRSRG